MPYGILAADQIQSSVTGVSLGAGNATRFKNRIINGDMRIDQRNAGATVTPSNANYTLDRWQAALTQNSKYSVGQNAGGVTPPVGFSNYLGVTSLSAYSSLSASDTFSIRQYIEGYNFADFGFGTANAKTVTWSFWVYSSLTGTFGGSMANYAGTRSYPFNYSIPVANTWTQISVTIPGDTGGTWAGATNAGAAIIHFGLGAGSTYSGAAGSWSSNYYVQSTGSVSVVGTNGATWYITGVQLEVGSSATGFEYVNYGVQLAQCQRYYWKGTISAGGVWGGASNVPIVGWSFPVSMRTAPSWAWVSGGSASNGNADYTITSTTSYTAYTDSARLLFTTSGGGTNTQGCALYAALCYFTAEL